MINKEAEVFKKVNKKMYNDNPVYNKAINCYINGTDPVELITHLCGMISIQQDSILEHHKNNTEPTPLVVMPPVCEEAKQYRESGGAL